VSDSVHKIDFDTFNDKLNDTYTLINKINSTGTRKFNEEDYNKLIGANSDLTEDFVKLGDDYLYVGSSMEALTDALEENTYALIDEAKDQLGAKTAIAKFANDKGFNTDMVREFDREQAINYLRDARDYAEATGWNLSALGEPGLNNDVVFSGIEDTNLLKAYAEKIADEMNKGAEYSTDYQKTTRLADIQKYITYNKASENAYLG
jgi:hypothetical protein